jgi:hypothetical protein
MECNGQEGCCQSRIAYTPYRITIEIPTSISDLRHQLWKLKFRAKNPYWLGRLRWNRWNYKHNIRGLYRWKWYEIINPWSKMPNPLTHRTQKL